MGSYFPIIGYELYPSFKRWHSFMLLNLKHTIAMNIKRIFGSILTVLGIVGLVYGAILFVNNTGGGRDMRALIVYGILGLIFLASGLSLVRTTKDEG